MENTDVSWKSEVGHIFDYYTERTPGSFVEHKTYAITWHYRLADSEFGYVTTSHHSIPYSWCSMFQSKECQNHLETSILSKLPVEILVGKKNLEVRPTMINKGEIVKNLLSQEQEWDFVFCAGKMIIFISTISKLTVQRWR